MKDYQRVLVVVRLIQSCQKAIQLGVSLARQNGARLYLIHSIHHPVGLKGWGLGTWDLAQEYEKSLADSKRRLLAMAEEEKATGLAVKVLIGTGEPTEEILRTVAEEKIDLLVMRAHEEGRVEHFLFGRSNEELIRKMPCSILLVKKEPGKALTGINEGE